MPLRVMTYNILEGGADREAYIQQVIQTVNPHLVILQEVTDPKILVSLAEACQMQLFLGTGNKKTKVALLSQIPVSNFKSHHPFFPIWHNIAEAEIYYQPNQSFLLIGVHLVANLWFGFELWRYLEVNYIIKRYKQFFEQPCLIAGDFNAIAPHDKVIIRSMPASLKAILFLQGNRVFRFSIQRLLSTGFIDSFRFINPSEDGFTLPPPQPNTRLDYIFINQAMQRHLVNCWVVREPNRVNEASDHYAVVAEFDLDIQN